MYRARIEEKVIMESKKPEKNSLKLLKVCSSTPEADLLKSRLASHDIPAFVATHSAYVQMDLTEGVKVMVPESLHAEALKIVEAEELEEE